MISSGVPIGCVARRAARLASATQLLRSLIEDRIVLKPVARPPHLPLPKGPGRKSQLIYEFEGATTLARVFADLISASSVVAPTEFDGARCLLEVDFDGVALAA
jgi:hypothetical protein